MNSRFVELKDKELEISQDLNFGYAGEVWDAALSFSNYLKKINFENKVILELGAGTAICGLVAAADKGVKKVYLTDKECNLKIIEKNYEINKDLLCKDVVITGIDWCDEKTYSNIKNEEFDYIICSELIWNPILFSGLVNTLNCFSNINTVVLLSYTYRKPSDLEFFKMIKDNKWTIEEVNKEEIDEDYRDEYITIFKLRPPQI